jgi:hypothetical protein
MSKKSRLSVVIALTAFITVVLALILPAVYLLSTTHDSNAITYIFGFTSTFGTFGGAITPVNTTVLCPLSFNLGSFLAILFVVLGSGLVVLFDRQISSYAFNLILSLVSLVLFLCVERFMLEANGVISGFNTYLRTGFGTYVSVGLCSLIAIESAIGIYILKADSSRRRR